MLVVSIPFSGFFILLIGNLLLVSLTGRGSCRLRVTLSAHGDKTVSERERDGERAPLPILLGVHISQSFGGWAEVNTGLTTDLAQKVTFNLHDPLPVRLTRSTLLISRTKKPPRGLEATDLGSRPTPW